MHAAHSRASAGGSALGSILQVAAALRAMLVAFQYICAYSWLGVAGHMQALPVKHTGDRSQAH